MPLLVRQPKLHGFKRDRKVIYEVLTLAMMEKMLPEGEYTLADLIDRRLTHAGRSVKILSTGTLSKKIIVEAHAASKSAVEAVKKAGGSITLIK